MEVSRSIAEVIVIAVALGLMPAAIADRKGESFLVWWLFGAILFIVALPCAFLLKDKSGKKCPACAEYVAKEALICKHCQSRF